MAIPVAATSHCYDNPNTPPPGTPGVVTEGFEGTTCGNVCWFLPNGTTSGYIMSGSVAPTNTFTSTTAYTGSSGTQWYVMGYCLEVDVVGTVLGTVPQGSHSAELDCDNGHGSAGNSSISTEAFLPAGNYELRYNYAARIDYPDYDPVYLCGSSASDVSWANDTNATVGTKTSVLRTNQINVYLDQNTDSQPPTHMTIDGTQTLAGSNLIDMCVYSGGWIQRSVRIKVTQSGYYWLSFAADGASDSFGGQIDNIMLCQGSCTGTLQDNFPTSWVAVNNVNKVLFKDAFESPTYSGSPYNVNGNMYNSKGTSGSSSGWPNQTASGWANAPYNQLPYWTSSCGAGTQCIELGWNSNSLVSRPFLLAPGYYQLSYMYIAEEQFSGLNSTYCGATPTAANMAYLSANSGSSTNWAGGFSNGTLTYDTNTVGVFMSHAQMASTPNLTSTLGATVNYTNPDGTTSTTPTVAPNGISLTSYNSSQVNPLLDICGYAPSWQTRTVSIQIVKPAYYWLTFAALGASDAFGGILDNVQLTALGSLYMANPPTTSLTTIPVPDPQPGSSTQDTGFFIIADPLEPPASTQ
jgi:hypothetical protein